MSDPVLLNSVHFVHQSQISVDRDHKFSSNIRSGGVCAVSSKYDVIYYSVKNTLFTIKMATLERSYWDDSDNLHDIQVKDRTSHNFLGDITHVSLSQSDRYLCVCFANTFSICDAKRIHLSVSQLPLVLITLIASTG